MSPGVVHAIPRTVAIVEHCDEVHFIDIRGNADRGALESNGVHYHRRDEIQRSRINIVNVQHLLRQIDPDIIVCHYAGGDCFNSAVAYGKCPVAVVAMGNDILYDEGDLPVPLTRRLLVRMGVRRVRYIAAKSKYLYERIRSYGATASMDVNYWGVDFARFRPADSAQARARIGVPATGPVILSARALEPRLNILMIVEAMSTILEDLPYATLVIIGRSTPEYRDEVVELINRLGIESNVVFNGEVSQQALVDYYNASDVTVSMATSEGFPNTLLEVMGCNVPIVVGRIPQIEELLVDGENAMICDFSAKAVANGIVKVLADTDRAREMTERARRTASEHADISRNGQIFVDKFRQQMVLGPASRIGTAVFRFVFALELIQRKLPHRWS